MKQKLFSKLKSLNSKGVAHHGLVAVLIVTAFAGFGAWRIFDASAASSVKASKTLLSVNTKEGCELTGKVWDSAKKKCKAECKVKSQKIVKTGTLKRNSHCKGNLTTNIKAKDCVEKLKRIYIKSNGCSRVESQKDYNEARQCQTDENTGKRLNYKSDYRGGTDYCVEGDGTPSSSRQNSVSLSSKAGCIMAGLEWSNNNCKPKCQNGVTVGANEACAGYVSFESEGECVNTLKRRYIQKVGCAKVTKFQYHAVTAIQGYSVDVPQCKAGYRIYYQNLQKCYKGASPSISSKRDNTKPALLQKTNTLLVSGQWESIDPRTGYSYAQQASYWQKSREIAQDLFELKMQIHGADQELLIGTQKFTKETWKQAESFLKKQTNGNLYGVWRWINEDPKDNLFNSYNPNKPFKHLNIATFKYDEAACQKSIAQRGWCDYSPSIGYNPNYFGSKAEQDAWVKKYKVRVTPLTYGPVDGKMGQASIVTGWGHTNASDYKFKYSDGTSPGFTGVVNSKNGTSPFKTNRPLTISSSNPR